MLQLPDTHLARLAIAATAIAPHVRGRWLAEIAARPDPPADVRGRDGGVREELAAGMGE